MISEHEERELTESRFWHPEIGREVKVVVRNWRFERRRFQQEVLEQPTLVLDVISIDGVNQLPVKEYGIRNRSLNKMLMHSIRLAEQAGRREVILTILRLDKTHYNVADMHLVNQALASAPSNSLSNQSTKLFYPDMNGRQIQ